MDKYYTSERNTQILIALMKAHGIKKVVVSPGATNVCLVGSIQQDSYFEIYSSVDERSAAYMACGLAAESGEPVALSCTGATASRNYVPGLTEAFYRQLPVLAITSTQHTGRVGNYVPQVIDRSSPLADMVKISVDIPTIYSDEDAWACNVRINKALLELTHHGGGPAHINLTTTYSGDFSVKDLPESRVIYRIGHAEQLPKLTTLGRVGVFVGNHGRWSDELTALVDTFCEKYNAVVFCDRLANYYGGYRINPCLVGGQVMNHSKLLNCDVLIHIGSISGADDHMGIKPKEVWRVNPDGEVRDTFKKLKYVFEMGEYEFFEKYCKSVDEETNTEYYNFWTQECSKILEKIGELPFSNAWIAQNTLNLIPESAVCHFGILNSLRSWSYFETEHKLACYANTGGFGIDGGVSSLVGASLYNPDKLYFGIIGDLAFFYDMNAIGNRHIGSNLRLMIINNGRGQEFRNSQHHAARFGEDANKYMAAEGHFGNKSEVLIKGYAEALGFEYYKASDKEEYQSVIGKFVEPKIGSKPILLEVFTDSKEESEAYDIVHNLEGSAIGTAKKMARNLLGDKTYETFKEILKK